MKTGEKNKSSRGDAEARSVAGMPPASLPSRVPVESDLEQNRETSFDSPCPRASVRGNWKSVKLGEVSEIIDGDRGKNYPKQSEFFGDGFCLFLNTGNVTSDGFDFTEKQFITEEKDSALRKGKLRRGDIVYTTRGTVGNAAYYSEAICWDHIRINSGMVILRGDEVLVTQRYLYQLLKSSYFRPYFKRFCTGSAQPQLPIMNLKNIEILLPPIKSQKRIAEILSAYDDLIENNRKQIKLLEEAAQRLYKEWFVDLRFPGHESVPVINGVPEGWKKVRLIDVATIQYGYAFDGTLFNSERRGTPIIRIRNIPQGTTLDYTTEEADAQYIVKNGDILVGMDGEFHINSWCGESAYLVQRTCRIKACDEKMSGWLINAIRAPIKYFEETVVGATVGHLGKKHLDSIVLLTAPSSFYVPFQLMFEQRQNLLNQNSKLTSARERLLPKLMSGEIEV